MFGEAESNYFCEMVQLPPALNPHTSPPAALNLVSLTQSRYSAFTISASKNIFGKKPMICTPVFRVYQERGHSCRTVFIDEEPEVLKEVFWPNIGKVLARRTSRIDIRWGNRWHVCRTRASSVDSLSRIKWAMADRSWSVASPPSLFQEAVFAMQIQ